MSPTADSGDRVTNEQRGESVAAEGAIDRPAKMFTAPVRQRRTTVGSGSQQLAISRPDDGDNDDYDALINLVRQDRICFAPVVSATACWHLCAAIYRCIYAGDITPFIHVKTRHFLIDTRYVNCQGACYF